MQPAITHTGSPSIQYQQTLPWSRFLPPPLLSSLSVSVRSPGLTWDDEGPVCGPGLSECQAQAQAAHSTLGPHTALRSQSREDRGERCLENTNSDTTAELIEAGDALKTDNTDAIPRCHFTTN